MHKWVSFKQYSREILCKMWYFCSISVLVELDTRGLGSCAAKIGHTFPRELVRRIGMNIYYLNSSDFARPKVLLGSLGLIIFEMGRPLTCTVQKRAFFGVDRA